MLGAVHSLIFMNRQTTRTDPFQVSIPAWRRLVFSAAILVPVSSGLVSTLPAPLPESVIRCVPCHRTDEMDQVGEWLASPYSASRGGLGCVDCHATLCSGVEGGEAFARSIPAENARNLRRAIRLSVTSAQSSDSVEAEVAVTNGGAGHFLPMAATGESFVLDVTAWGRDAGPLPLESETPPRAFRLAPFATDVSSYRFAAPEEWPVQVTARLLLVTKHGNPVELANTTTVCGSSTRSN